MTGDERARVILAPSLARYAARELTVDRLWDAVNAALSTVAHEDQCNPPRWTAINSTRSSCRCGYVQPTII